MFELLLTLIIELSRFVWNKKVTRAPVYDSHEALDVNSQPLSLEIDGTLNWTCYLFNFRFNKFKETRTILREINKNLLSLSTRGKAKEFLLCCGKLRWLPGAKEISVCSLFANFPSFPRFSLGLLSYHRNKKVFNGLRLLNNHPWYLCHEFIPDH